MDDFKSEPVKLVRKSDAEFQVEFLAEMVKTQMSLRTLKTKLTVLELRANDNETVRSIGALSRALLDFIETGNEHLINQYIDSL